MKMEETECSKTSAYKIQKLGNHPKERIQQMDKIAQNNMDRNKGKCISDQTV